MTNKAILDLPKSAFKNKQKIDQSKVCGCYHCATIFDSSQVVKWTDQSSTALCPSCNVDSVVGDVDFSITTDLLKEAQQYWF